MSPIANDASFLPAASALQSLPRLGIGLLYNPSLAQFVETDLDAVDYLEIIPDMFQSDHGLGRTPRFTRLTHAAEVLDRLAAVRPLIAHNVGLSIGSAEFFDAEYRREMRSWQRRCGFVWQSEHLSFVRLLGADGDDHHTALPLPVPYDEAALDLVAEQVEAVHRALGVPLLIENNVYFAEIPEQEMTEPAFLNELARRTGCGLLLDLHNLYCNAHNFGFDPATFLDELNLEPVVELHFAGGNEVEGFWTDSHSGPCPEMVWDLVASVIPRARNLKAVTFEFQESYFEVLGTAGVRAALDRARELWPRRRRGGAEACLSRSFSTLSPA